VKEEKEIGSSQRRFSKGKSHLANLIAFCAEVAVLVDEWWPAHLDFSGFCRWAGAGPCTGWGLTAWGAVLPKSCGRAWGPVGHQVGCDLVVFHASDGGRKRSEQHYEAHSR